MEPELCSYFVNFVRQGVSDAISMSKRFFFNYVSCKEVKPKVLNSKFHKCCRALLYMLHSGKKRTYVPVSSDFFLFGA